MPHSYDMERDLMEGNYPWEAGNASTGYMPYNGGNGYANGSSTMSATTMGDYALFGGAESNSVIAHKLTTGSLDPNTVKLSDLSEVKDANGLYKPGRYIGINGKAIPVDKYDKYRTTLKYMGVENVTSELPGSDNNIGDLRYVREDNGVYCWNGNIWVKLAEDPTRGQYPTHVVNNIKPKPSKPKYDPKIINRFDSDVINNVLFLDKFYDISYISVNEILPKHVPTLSILVTTYIILIVAGITVTTIIKASDPLHGMYLNLLARIMIGLYVGLTLKAREQKPKYEYIITVDDHRFFDMSPSYKITDRFRVVGWISDNTYVLKPIIYKYNYPF